MRIENVSTFFWQNAHPVPVGAAPVLGGIGSLYPVPFKHFQPLQHAIIAFLGLFCAFFAYNFSRISFLPIVEHESSHRHLTTVQLPSLIAHGLTSSGSLGITADGATDLTSDPWLKTEDKATITTFVTELFEYFNASEDLSISPANATIGSVTQSFTGGSHWVGSCVMGETNDNSSVVDTDTRVWDTDNLFVADASIHPDLPTGNTQVSSVVAEKAAEKIIALEIFKN